MKRDMDVYSQDVWNSIDLTALVILVGGILVRVFDNSSPWGRGLYAMSAPFMFSRLLFFAQIFRFQGPMIQVIFSMTVQLVQFGLVMVVVMFGFAMSFFALFDDVHTFRDTLLTLFKVMLGDTGFFDDFEDEPYNRYQDVATILLALYVVVFIIVLLNLLIAVLSTSHSQVQENAEQEFKVTKARLVQRYRLVVDEDLLPAPFNLLPIVLSLPLMVYDGCRHSTAYTRAKRAIGQMVFWLMLGPVALSGGVILWVVSAPYSLYLAFAAWGDVSTSILRSRALDRSRLCSRWEHVFWCLCVAPVQLLTLYVSASPMASVFLPRRFRPTPTSFSPSAESRAPADVSVHDILKEAPGRERVGADDLRRFLEDPMSDPEVRRDELNRPTTVEHMKLLRDRLEAVIKDHVDEKLHTVEEEVRGVKTEREMLSDDLSRKLEGVLEVVSQEWGYLEERLGRELGGVSRRLELLEERLGETLGDVRRELADMGSVLGALAK